MENKAITFLSNSKQTVHTVTGLAAIYLSEGRALFLSATFSPSLKKFMLDLFDLKPVNILIFPTQFAVS